ncbi:MAG: C13 family peptidase [Erythrobacter sp.]|nr:C13 family peptidase [Erythrobacter sp.]
MIKLLLIAGLVGALLAVPDADEGGARVGGGGDPVQPPPHTAPYPDLGTGETRKERRESFELGPEMRRGIGPRELLEQRRRLDAALGALAPQRSGTVDAYVIAIALDSDPVFAREAREAGAVLERRFDARGRTLVLAGPDGARDDRPQGSIEALLTALARLAELMDPAEDVLVLYTTSHGLDLGLAYHYGDTGYGVLSPQRLKAALEELGIERRIIMLSACFSGVFVPALASPDTAIMTAAAANRTSFGCAAENDWTFYGDALVNTALREPQGLEAAAAQATRLVAQWEADQRLLASLPQTRIGAAVNQWLPALEARMPQTATARVGRPAVAEREAE